MSDNMDEVGDYEAERYDYDDGYGVKAELRSLPQFTINPRWRSSQAIDLCRAYRAERDLSLLPKLADALMDAWCEDQALIAACHETKESAYALRLVAIIESDELAGKVKWLEGFCNEWSFRFRSAVDEPQGADGVLVRQGSDLYGSDELGDDARKYFDAVEAITGRTFNESYREDFGWSCTC